MRLLLILAGLLLSTAAPAQTISYSNRLVPATFGAPASTVAGLAACSAALSGQIYTVTDALLPALNVAVAGGGAVTVMVRCNGTNWIVGQ